MYNTRGRPRRGSITLLFLGLIIPFFFAMGILVFDLGLATFIKNDLYNVANAAAVSGAKGGFDEDAFMNSGVTSISKIKAIAAVKANIEANKQTRPWLQSCNDSDITFSGNNSITVKANGKVNTAY